MKLDDILSLWQDDCKIDPTDLGNESLSTSQLHHKYLKMHSGENILLRKKKEDLKRLKLDKAEFYFQGPHEQTPKHWKLPAIGRIIKSEIPTYVEADEDIIHATLDLALQQEKVDVLESIIKVITNRGWQISNAINWFKFQAGER